MYGYEFIGFTTNSKRWDISVGYWEHTKEKEHNIYRTVMLPTKRETYMIGFPIVLRKRLDTHRSMRNSLLMMNLFLSKHVDDKF